MRNHRFLIQFHTSIQQRDIVDPSGEEEANIAETARRLDEPMLQIEDES